MTRADVLAAYAAGPDAVVDLVLGMDARLRTLEGRLARYGRSGSTNGGLTKCTDIH